MLSTEFLSEASGPPVKWNLSVGAELSNPRDRELAVVQSIDNYDLRDVEQHQQFKTLAARYHDTEAGRSRSGYSSFIALNEPSDANPIAHVVILKIVAGRRSGKQLMYVSCDNNSSKVWSSYPGTSGRNLNISNQEHRKKLERILRSSLLPVEPPKQGKTIDSQLSLSAGNYWQIVDLGARPNRARDRIKPNEISSLYHTERQWWDQHPDIVAAKQALVTAKQGGDRDAVRAAKEKLDRVVDGVRSDRPTSDMMQSSPLRANQIDRLIAGSRARSSGNNRWRSYLPQRKKEYLMGLLSKFTETPDNPSAVYPLTLVDDTSARSTLTNIGVGDSKSITTDFMEVVHPLAIVSGNFSGTARNYILEHLGAQSFSDLLHTASIGYGANNTGKLVDSFVYNNSDGVVKKLQLSSKSGAGAPASVKSLEVAYEEVLRNPASKDMWEREILPLEKQVQEYDIALQLINTLVVDKNKSWQAATSLAQSIGAITPRDVQLINQWASGISSEIDKSEEENDDDEEDIELDALLKESKRTQKMKIPRDIFSQFSAGLKAMYENTPVEVDNDWTKVIGALWERIAFTVNKNDAFGNLAVWLFNHSATVQVNTVSNQTEKRGVKQLILKNIVATWPTQLVETAKLTRGQSKDSATIRFELVVNGHPQVLGTADISTPQTLRNRTYDIPSMRGAPKRGTVNPYDNTLSNTDKRIASTRRIGTGTNAFQLPQRSVGAGGVSGSDTAPPIANTPIQKIQQFLISNGIIGNVEKPNNYYGKIKDIIENPGHLSTQFVTNLQTLLADSQIQQVAKLIARSLPANHPREIPNLYEAKFINDTTAEYAVGALYWAYYARMYYEYYLEREPQSDPKNNPNFKQALNLVKELLTALVPADQVENERRKHLRTISLIGTQMAPSWNSAAPVEPNVMITKRGRGRPKGSKNQSKQSSQSQQSQTTQQSAVVLSPQQLAAAMQQVRAAIGAQKFTEYRDDIRGELENGTAVEKVINGYRSLEESRSAILQGLLG